MNYVISAAGIYVNGRCLTKLGWGVSRYVLAIVDFRKEQRNGLGVKGGRPQVVGGVPYEDTQKTVTLTDLS